MSRMFDMPDAPFLNGPDCREEVPDAEDKLLNLSAEVVDILERLPAALKHQSVTRQRKECLEILDAADNIINAAHKLVLGWE